MNNENLERAKSFINNPLGIMGLFLVFVDSIAAIVVVNSKLEPSLNKILVIFIVSFPVLVLIVFYLLVTRYSKNLYAPSDYKNEENFLKVFDRSSNSEINIPIDSIQPKKSKTSGYPENLHNKIEIDLAKFEVPRTDEPIMARTIENSNNPPIESLTKYLENENTSDINITKKLEDNLNLNQYTVAISHELKNNLSLCNEYNNLGIMCSIHEGIKSTRPNAGNEAIWLGRNVPIDITKKVISLAHQFYPELKYINISGDDRTELPDYIHNEIFIGGSTRTAIERKSKPLEALDFQKINSFDTIDELHKFIKQLYYQVSRQH